MHNVGYQGYFLRGLGGNSAALDTAQSDAIRNITGRMGGSSFEKLVYGIMVQVHFINLILIEVL